MSTKLAVAETLPALEAPPASERDEIRSFIERRLARWAGASETVVVSVPAPVVAPETLLEVSPRPLGLLWDPPDGRAFAGTGAAHRVELDGPGRFTELRRRAEEIWRRLRVEPHPDAPRVVPRLYGGLAFDVGAARGEPWREFGDGGFTLPRIAYGSDGARAALSLAARGVELAEKTARESFARELAGVAAALRERRIAGAPAIEGGGPVLRIERPPYARWREDVEAIRQVIADGSFDKIVAASSSRVELATAPAVVAVLRRLSRGLRASTRFAFQRPECTFLGATPERLISRRGLEIATEALAGSIEPGEAGAERLLGSAKDRREHELVVEQIVRRLGPLCDRLAVASAPAVRELRDVLHLLTPIAGTLAAPRHVLELVEELHPTPAVGGVPTEAAMAWISEHERARRGWYAAPVGWFDAAGDGDFAVALRSCVLRGREAFLYAGAGIVRDSDPDLEYTETELKKQALLTALGA